MKKLSTRVFHLWLNYWVADRDDPESLSFGQAFLAEFVDTGLLSTDSVDAKSVADTIRKRGHGHRLDDYRDISDTQEWIYQGGYFSDEREIASRAKESGIELISWSPTEEQNEMNKLLQHSVFREE